MLRRGILKARVSPPSRYGGADASSRFLKWQLAASRIPTFWAAAMAAHASMENELT
jgi:hypothetical protein